LKEESAQVLDYVIEYSLYLLVFFLPISKAPLQVFSSIAFVAFVAKKIIKPDFKFLNSPLHYFLIGFVFFSCLSLVNSGPHLGKSFIALFFKWFKYLGLFLFFEDTFINKRRIRNLLIIILVSSLLVGVDGIFQKLTSFDFIRHREIIQVVPGVYGVSAAFNHYNGFGTYLIVILSLIISLSISGKLKIGSFLFLLFLEILLSICLVYTFSRGAWLGFISGLILMLLLSSRNMAKKLVFLIPVFIGILIIVPELRDRIMFTFTPRGDADRIKVWHVAFVMIKESPLLGKGIGLFMDNFTRIVSDNSLFAQYAHNCYLQIWAETGIFSFLSFLAFTATLLINGIRAFKMNNNYIVLGLVCGLFGFLVHSFFDTQFYSLQAAMFFWALAGILNVLSEKHIEV
jgi:putative inorganic carbon (HCO3(-)) transporter